MPRLLLHLKCASRRTRLGRHNSSVQRIGASLASQPNSQSLALSREGFAYSPSQSYWASALISQLFPQARSLRRGRNQTAATVQCHAHLPTLVSSAIRNNHNWSNATVTRPAFSVWAGKWDLLGAGAKSVGEVQIGRFRCRDQLQCVGRPTTLNSRFLSMLLKYRSLAGILAEREGFEPPIPLRVCLISSQVHSTGLCHLSVFLSYVFCSLYSIAPFR